MAANTKPPVTERTPKEGPEAGYKVDVPQPTKDENPTAGTFVKHYVLPNVEGETDQSNDMIDSALRLGLRPTGNPKRVGEKPHQDDSAKTIEWSIPVAESDRTGDLFVARDAANGEAK